MNISPIRPFRDGDGPFYDDPSDLAVHAQNALRNIEAGQPYITDITLRYLEEEAIARFAKQTGMRPDHEPDKRTDRSLWVAKWENEARYADAHIDSLNDIARASVRVLITACQLRGAIEDKGDPQKIAALSMLLICEVLMGGYMLEVFAEMKRADTFQEQAHPFIVRHGAKTKDAKTIVYEKYALQFPRNNIGAVHQLRLDSPETDDGKSPFFWNDRVLIDRKTGEQITEPDMRGQLQKARQRMKKPINSGPKKTVRKVS